MHISFIENPENYYFFKDSRVALTIKLICPYMTYNAKSAQFFNEFIISADPPHIMCTICPFDVS